MTDKQPRPGPTVHWQTTISERGGIICVSVPQASREAAMAAAEAMERAREWAGRAVAPDAEVLVELWDEATGRAIERTLLKTNAAGVIELRPMSQAPDPQKEVPRARPKKRRKPDKKTRRSGPGRKR